MNLSKAQKWFQEHPRGTREELYEGNIFRIKGTGSGFVIENVDGRELGRGCDLRDLWFRTISIYG